MADAAFGLWQQNVTTKVSSDTAWSFRLLNGLREETLVTKAD
jgi:hypothetical protein